MKTIEQPSIEQYKSIQVRYEALTKLFDSITEVVQLDDEKAFMFSIDYIKLVDTQEMIQREIEKHQKQAEKLAVKLKKWK